MCGVICRTGRKDLHGTGHRAGQNSRGPAAARDREYPQRRPLRQTEGSLTAPAAAEGRGGLRGVGRGEQEFALAKILVVDDEKAIVKGIRFSLLQDGYEVDCAYDGEQALEMAKKTNYNVVLLDLMLPKMDGMQVCQAIREFSDMPIIMLTAKGDDMDKILGLENGADDYITKPFNILEVKARIKAIMRRSRALGTARQEADDSVIETGDLRLDTKGRRLFIRGEEINLTQREFELLELLVRNPNRVFSREELLKRVWGEDYPGDVRTVDVHIRRLREKIETTPSDPKYIYTKWGVGYFYKQ